MTPELQERLEKARLAQEAAESARTKRAAESASIKAVEDAERAAANAIAINAAEQEHGEIGRDIALVDTPYGVVIVKRPHQALFRRFQDSKGSTTDVEKMSRPSVVYPDSTKLDRIYNDFPGVLLSVGLAVQALADGKRKETEEKS